MLTLFNIRLGRWCSNPARDKWYKPGPVLGFLCLLKELFGMSDADSRYIYLSDGGHFDNLGVYELVRRHCSVIVCVDASADPNRSFDDLGRTIQRCRVDFGVEIRLPQLDDMCSGVAGQLPRSSFTIGEIDYNPGGAAQDGKGKFVYIKPTLRSTKDEPVDVLSYAGRNPQFPHQSTADQWFDESQFESYRKLGRFITEELDRAKPLFCVPPWLETHYQQQQA